MNRIGPFGRVINDEEMLFSFFVSDSLDRNRPALVQQEEKIRQKAVNEVLFLLSSVHRILYTISAVIANLVRYSNYSRSHNDVSYIVRG